LPMVPLPKPRHTRGESEMNTMEKFILLLIILIVSATAAGVLNRTPNYPDQIPEPVQRQLSAPETIEFEGKNGPVTLELLAEYEITAVVKGRKNYTSDASASVSPVDLALAWGNLNQRAIDDTIDYTQSGRWYYYRLSPNAPVSVYDVQIQSANTHLIPKDEDILKQIKKIDKHDLIRLEGYLVSVTFDPQLPEWSSSLTRTDSGNRACEILYVTEVEIK